MATLSADDKAKGKRIISQFFRTMPGVQKSLLTIFEKEGYDGVYRLHKNLYPENATPIDSIDTLRKGLSMILQHIYGMPVEDKEGYFQDILKCKTANQVVRREKETLVNYFYSDYSTLQNTLRDMMLEDRDFRLMNAFCQKFLGEETEEVTDMRSFKNQIRTMREAVGDQITSGTSEDEIVSLLKEKKEDVESQPPPPPAEEEVSSASAEPGLDDHAGEKRRIITDVLADDKYAALREVLLQTTVADPNFDTFQTYLDNILASRFVADSMETFSQGVQKIKEFRDTLEKELVS